jgi:hypothetical protein
MSSPCVQPFHQESLNHDNPSAAAMLRFVNPNNLNHGTSASASPSTAFQHQQQQQHHHPYDYHYIKRHEEQQQQDSNHRRFSYASMLSDPEPCYLPISHSPSNESEDATTTSSSSSVSPTPTMPYETNPVYNSSLPPMMDKPFYYNQSLYNRTMYTPPPPNPVITNKSSSPNIISPFMSTPKPEIVQNFSPQQKKMPRSRGRRVSNNPTNNGARMFTCKTDGCGKIFKRSEHLKRHIRSIHTLEKRKFSTTRKNEKKN